MESELLQNISKSKTINLIQNYYRLLSLDMAFNLPLANGRLSDATRFRISQGCPHKRGTIVLHLIYRPEKAIDICLSYEAMILFFNHQRCSHKKWGHCITFLSNRSTYLVIFQIYLNIVHVYTII